MRKQIFRRVDRMVAQISGRRERRDEFVAQRADFEIAPVRVAVPYVDIVIAARERHVFIRAGEIQLDIAIGFLKRCEPRQQAT